MVLNPQTYDWRLIYTVILPLSNLHFRLDINYFYVVHETGKGLLSYARGRPTKDRKSASTNGYECTLEMSDKILELRSDYNMHEGTKMLLFISIATNDMVKYVCMYPEVWFLDCTYGESTSSNYSHLLLPLVISYVTSSCTY